MTRCNICHVSKRSSAFGYQNRGVKRALRTQCKECRNKIETDRYKSESEDRKLKRRDAFYKKTYNITLAEYNALFMQQEGKCASYGGHQSSFKKALVIDHNHKTGKVRGLLCSNDNVALGLLKENPTIINDLAAYIQRFE